MVGMEVRTMLRILTLREASKRRRSAFVKSVELSGHKHVVISKGCCDTE